MLCLSLQARAKIHSGMKPCPASIRKGRGPEHGHPEGEETYRHRSIPTESNASPESPATRGRVSSDPRGVAPRV